MKLPFTQEQFFELFAEYNEAVWPLQLVFNVAAIAMVVILIRTPGRAGKLVSFGLAFLWFWVAVVYHLAFFWRINPAAPFFVLISLAAAEAFLWFGFFRPSLCFRSGMDARKIAGVFVVLFALAGYPIFGALLGHHYPAAPTFGLPCPTTIFTFGVLLMAARPLPWLVLVAPMVWAAIGAAAAFSLGVTQDIALLVMMVLGGYMLLSNQSPIEPPLKADGPRP